MPLILEGIVTTHNDDGSVNVSPMGPIVDRSVTSLLLRPFNTSTTYRNLRRDRRGVFHVTDDVELLARAAVGALPEPPSMRRHASSGGWILEDACRWYAFEVAHVDDRTERTSIQCDVADAGRGRDFFGFNRAKHAVLEAAILATRTRFLPPEEIRDEMERLEVVVRKTAGEQESRAFAFLWEFIDAEIGVQKS